jgi:peptide/nickel transport system ATP-binding protein
MSDGALLQIENLHVGFEGEGGSIPAVRGLDLTMQASETVALVGESGCGKSVTALSVMRLLARSGRIERGSVRFDGRDLSRLSDAEMRTIRGREIGMIFQEPMTSLNPVFTVGKQIAEVLSLHRGFDAEKARIESESLLSRVGISSPERRIQQYPHELSGGMKQRVMIAMALACRPKLLIADEPTTALDVTIQAQILALLKSLQAELKMAILIITHDLGVVAHFAESVHVMYAGKVIEHAPTLELFERPLHPYTRALLGALPKATSHAPAASGAKKVRLEAIPGRVPSPSALLPGCAFTPRCKSRLERCPKDLPELVTHGERHQVACWLHEQEAK